MEMTVKLLAEVVVNQLQAWLWLGNLLPCSISDSQESVSCWLETYSSHYLVISIGYLRKKKAREKQRGQENSNWGPDASSFLQCNHRGNILSCLPYSLHLKWVTQSSPHLHGRELCYSFWRQSIKSFMDRLSKYYIDFGL